MFQYEREVWQGRARSETSNGRLARAAYACKYVTYVIICIGALTIYRQAYRYTMLLEKARESFPADIDIVSWISLSQRALIVRDGQALGIPKEVRADLETTE